MGTLIKSIVISNFNSIRFAINSTLIIQDPLFWKNLFFGISCVLLSPLRCFYFYEYSLNYWDNSKFESIKIMESIIFSISNYYYYYYLYFIFSFIEFILIFTRPTKQHLLIISAQKMKDPLIYDYYLLTNTKFNRF